MDKAEIEALTKRSLDEKQHDMKLLAVFSLFLIANVYGDENKVKLSIYYETLCPDSIRFFRYQFDKTYPDLLPYINVYFVPYGHARHTWEDGKWNIQCQYGQKECVGNRFHACALAQNNGYENDVRFISCSMRSANPTSYLQLMWCAEEVGIPFEPIESCFRSGEGHELLVKYGEKTAALTPKLTYVPTIVFNDVYEQTKQNSAEINLRQTICEHLHPVPNVC